MLSRGFMQSTKQWTFVGCMISIILGALLIGPPPVGATETGDGDEPIGATLELMASMVEKHGVDAAPLPETEEGRFTADGASAILRFSEPLTDAQQSRLRDAGIRLDRTESGAFVRIGSMYSGFVPWTAFETLRQMNSLVRAEATWQPAGTVPLETTGSLVGAHEARRQPDLALNGDGITLADVDSSFYIFHPHFFRADAGWYDWIDVDGDGELTPGVDGVDLNDSGSIENDEILRVLDGATLSRRTGDVSGNDGQFAPAVDWLYVDSNRDQNRNVGPNQGFTESTPGYGEPTFVADDIDDDGTLEPAEKLVRLGSSKFKRIVEDETTYTRGSNLIQVGKPDRDRRSGHGTSVTSVMAGGQPRFHDRVGLAPAAELVGYSRTLAGQRGGIDTDGMLRYLDDARTSSVDVVVHEYSGIVRNFLDGSSSVEQAIDQTHNAGVSQVTPVGNLNESQSHIEKTVTPGQTTTMTYNVGDGLSRGGQTYPFFAAYGALLWQANNSLTARLVAPNGDTKLLDGTNGSIADSNIQVRTRTSPRGTKQLYFTVYNQSQTSIEKGDWTVEISGAAQSETVIGRVTDPLSSWSVGIHWVNPTKNKGTITWPSTADEAFGVAAFNGNDPNRDAGIGELFGYSGRGPRIDGTPVVDIAAPANPYAALAFNSQYRQLDIGNGSFTRFGGTSGAGPHVAAAVGLMAELQPNSGPDSWESSLVSTADQTNLQPAPQPQLPARNWGYGKIDLYEAAAGSDPPSDNLPPSASIDASLTDESIRLDATASSDPDQDSLSYRFDVDYDGTWEVAWQSDAVTTVAPSAYDGTLTDQDIAKVQVRDDAGRKAAAATRLGSLESPPSQSDAGMPDSGGTSPGSDTGLNDGDDSNDDPSGGTDDSPSLQRADDNDNAGCGCSSGDNSPRGIPALTLMLAGLLVYRFRRPRG